MRGRDRPEFHGKAFTEMVARKNEEKQDPSTDVESAVPNWGEAENFIDVQAIADEFGIPTFAGSALFGDGADLMDKQKLVGVPFKILDWRIVLDDKTKREYVTVLAMANLEGRPYKVRFNDGSTGIMAQLKHVNETHGKCIIECRNGLRRSDYTFTNDKGGTEAATTFYLT